jgi:hypothetical protein
VPLGHPRSRFAIRLADVSGVSPPSALP